MLHLLCHSMYMSLMLSIISIAVTRGCPRAGSECVTRLPITYREVCTCMITYTPQVCHNVNVYMYVILVYTCVLYYVEFLICFLLQFYSGLPPGRLGVCNNIQ